MAARITRALIGVVRPDDATPATRVTQSLIGVVRPDNATPATRVTRSSIAVVRPVKQGFDFEIPATWAASFEAPTDADKKGGKGQKRSYEVYQTYYSEALESRLPKAAILIYTNAADLTGVADDDANLSIGFTDGTSQYCVVATSQDGQTAPVLARGLYNDRVIARTTAATTEYATFDRWTPGGIRLKWHNQDGDNVPRIVGVILFAGENVQASVGLQALSGALHDITAPGFQPDLVITATPGRALGAEADYCTWALGWGTAGAQRGYVQESEPSDPTDVHALALSGAVAGKLAGGSSVWQASLDDFDGSGFSFSVTGTPGGDAVVWLALRMPDTGIWVGEAPVPSGAGNLSKTGIGIHPAFVMQLLGAATAYGTPQQGGAWGLGAFSSGAEFMFNLTDQDGQADTNTSSEFKETAVRFRGHDQSVKAEGAFVSFQDGGWTLNYSYVSGIAAWKWLALAFAQETAGDPADVVLPVASLAALDASALVRPESAAGVRAAHGAPVEWGLQTAGLVVDADHALLIEWLAGIRGQIQAPISADAAARSDHALLAEWIAGLISDAWIAAEHTLEVSQTAGTRVEILGGAVLDGLSPLSWTANPGADQALRVEWLAALQRSLSLPSDVLQGAARTATMPVARLAGVTEDHGVPIEWTGFTLLTADSAIPVSWVAQYAVSHGVPLEHLLEVLLDRGMVVGWLAGASADAASPLEWTADPGTGHGMRAEWIAALERSDTVALDWMQAADAPLGFPAGWLAALAPGLSIPIDVWREGFSLIAEGGCEIRLLSPGGDEWRLVRARAAWVLSGDETWVLDDADVAWRLSGCPPRGRRNG